MQIRAVQIRRDFIRAGNGTNILTAVQETSLVLSPGGLTLIMGRSGSGKSTLLNMLAGLLRPSAGTVFYDDTDIYSLSDEALSAFRNRTVGYVPQGQSLLASLTVFENILLPYTLYGDASAGERYARELIARLGMESFQNAMPRELSGGEMRRAAIARALIRKPAVLFADEPTGDLDDENTATVLRMLQDIAESAETAVVLVSHENEAKAYAGRLYRMNAGRLQEGEEG